MGGGNIGWAGYILSAGSHCSVPMPKSLLFGSALLCAGAMVAHAQPVPTAAERRIPVRRLGPVVASARDTLSTRVVVHPLSDGSVLVGVWGPANTLQGQSVKLFDPTLQQVTLVRDSSQVPQIIPAGDSAILLDRQARSMVLIDGRGRDVRTLALPKASDLNQLTPFLRAPRLDRHGALIYQGATPPPEEPTIERLQSPFQPDSAPLVRANFDTRRVDTIARIRIAQPVRTTFGDHGRNIAVDNVIDPMAAGDEWTMLPDGTVAIVREHDYHIDWIDPDGTRRSTGRMPMDWRRITDERKQFIIDSMRPTLDSLAKRTPPRTLPTPDGPRTTTWNYAVVPPARMRDYEPPIGPGSVRADLDGNLWIAPRTSSGAAGGGLLYDVVNRKGEITERVQFPPGVALAGFGPNGAVYVLRVQGTAGFLERARLR